MQMHCQGVLETLHLRKVIDQEEMQVASIMTGRDIATLLEAEPVPPQIQDHYGTEQLTYPRFREMIEFLHKGTVPFDDDHATKIAAQVPQFVLTDSVIHIVDHKHWNRT